jgi:CheY-like chemotaxis protein
MLHTHSHDPSTAYAGMRARDIRMLLLDDSNFDRQRIRRMTVKTDLLIQMDEVDSIQALDRAVTATHYDLILIDYRLPEGDGMIALDHVLKNPANRDAGKIMITGDNNLATAVEAMRAGCHDFLAKEDLNADLLRDAVVKAIELAGERRQMVMQLELQREMLREGIVAGLSDGRVQAALGDLIQQKMILALPQQPGFGATMDPSDIDALLATFAGEDEFIFH